MARVRARSVCSAGLLALWAGRAMAQTLLFSLPEEPLADSLKVIAQESGQNILFTPQSVAGLRAPALRGQMKVRDALNFLLRGTGLSVSEDAGGLIVEAQTKAPARLEEALPKLPPEPILAQIPAEEVVVSASRISLAHYQQPTPVTMLGPDLLERDAMQQLGDEIRQLPSMGVSSSPNNGVNSALIVTGTQGLDVLSLRNLGYLRTLVLFDGQRVVQSSIMGGVDLSTMPEGLVKRVDVVTGGASAAWGSDAVAGVVNVIFDKNFEGFSANLEGGDNDLGNHRSFKSEASYGADFAGGRGHLIGSLFYLTNPDAYFAGSAPWFKAQKLVTNLASATSTGSRYVEADWVGLAQATQGGLITGNPANTAGANADALKGIQFVGNGTTTRFGYGNVTDGFFSNGGGAETTEGDLATLAIPLRSTTLFGYGSYQISPTLKVSLELNFGETHSKNNSYSHIRYGDLTILRDNAYLPAGIATQMDALGVTNFQLGTTNLNDLPTTGRTLPDNSLATEALSLGIPVSLNQRRLTREVVSLDGLLGDSWSWNAYYQHGQARAHFRLANNVEKAAFANAVDSVLVTQSNVGSSGLALGSIACRSTLADPSNGCQPLDVFGHNIASDEAIQYVNGAARRGDDAQVSILNEDVASFSAQGEVPFGLDAGRIAVALGGEYRNEEGRAIATPIAAARSFSVGNFGDFAGRYNVAEGFVEVNAPLIKGGPVESLDFNGAGRLTYYSTSGLVETWKLGLTSQLNDDVRLRSTWSFDIRAPDLYELFSEGTAILSSGIDPRSGANVTTYHVSQGNPGLSPEQSVTLSGGVVLTPSSTPGFSFSAGWYSISITKAIATISASVVLEQCRAGVTRFCDQLAFAGPGGPLSRVTTFPINANAQTVSGLDFHGDYQTALWQGQLDLNLVGNYTDEQTQTDLTGTFDYAGSLGPDSGGAGIPKFRTILAVTYSRGPWSGTLRGRLIGAARDNNAWDAAIFAGNEIPAVAYLDLRASFRWSPHVQFYAAVDNLAGRPPPIIPATDNAVTDYEPPVRSDVYDSLGRVGRAGIRFRF